MGGQSVRPEGEAERFAITDGGGQPHRGEIDADAAAQGRAFGIAGGIGAAFIDFDFVGRVAVRGTVLTGLCSLRLHHGAYLHRLSGKSRQYNAECQHQICAMSKPCHAK